MVEFSDENQRGGGRSDSRSPPLVVLLSALFFATAYFAFAPSPYELAPPSSSHDENALVAKAKWNPNRAAIDSGVIMEADLTTAKRCEPNMRADFHLSMSDIHSTNPYGNFTPSVYGVVGPDSSGWGIDESLARIMERARPRFMVEVGSWKGASAIQHAKQMRGMHGSDTCIMLLCVDTWLGTTVAWESPDMENPKWGNTLYLRNGYPSVYYQFLYNVVHERVEDIVVPLPLPGVMGAIFLERKRATPDAIYIDGCHDEICVRQDLESWFPLLNAKGAGILFGDDYDKAGVKRAVASFCTSKIGCAIDAELTGKRTYVLRKFG